MFFHFLIKRLHSVNVVLVIDKIHTWKAVHKFYMEVFMSTLLDCLLTNHLGCGEVNIWSILHETNSRINKYTKLYNVILIVLTLQSFGVSHGTSRRTEGAVSIKCKVVSVSSR